MFRTALAFLLLSAGLLCGQSAKPAGGTSAAAPSFDAVAATNAYLAKVPPDKKARSDAYFEGGYWLILWDFLYGAAISVLLLSTRLSARMRSLAERMTRFQPLRTFAYWVQYLVVTFVLGFPLSVYEGFFREHQYGLATQTFVPWLGDQLKALVVALVLGGLAVTALFGIVRRLPRTWHIWGAIAAMALIALQAVIFPVFIAPLFNQYTKLADPAVRNPILSLARANGIPANEVYEVDTSRQSTRISANVSGFLGTERISLNDNLLTRSTLPEIMSVMGHEMGHYVLNHVYKGLLVSLIVLVVFFAGLRRTLEWSLARWGARWEIGRLRYGCLTAGRTDHLDLQFSVHAHWQHGHANHGVRGRSVRPQRGPPAGCLRRDCAQAGRIPQAQPGPARRNDFVRSPLGPHAHLLRHALESGEYEYRRGTAAAIGAPLR